MNNIDHCRYSVFSMCWIFLSISSTAILKFSNSNQLQMQLNFLNKKWISYLLRPATYNTLVLSQPDANPIPMSIKVFTLRPLLSNSFFYFSRAINFGESKYTLSPSRKWVIKSPPINNVYTPCVTFLACHYIIMPPCLHATCLYDFFIVFIHSFLNNFTSLASSSYYALTMGINSLEVN